MKSFVFPVEVEPEELGRAYVPDLEAKGAATWGHAREEALRNIQEVAQMVIEVMLEGGETLPTSIQQSEKPIIAVSVS